jgi:hypothetical protein
MTDKINKIFEICVINDFEFTYQNEGQKNYITYSLNPNKILINISDINDVELEKLLDDKFKELKETFK